MKLCFEKILLAQRTEVKGKGKAHCEKSVPFPIGSAQPHSSSQSNLFCLCLQGRKGKRMKTSCESFVKLKKLPI